MVQGRINGKPVSATDGESIHTILAENDSVIDAPCGGRHKCGKCKVKASGMLSEMTEEEKEFLTDKELEAGIRLACFCIPKGDFSVVTGSAAFEIETKLADIDVKLEPAADTRKFVSAYGRCLGMAVDIGTTTVAATFYDLSTGENLYTASGINAQKVYGADVMSRIEYALNNDDGDLVLHKAIINQLNGMIAEFTAKTGLSASCIAEAVIAGNTTMELLAAGFSVKSLGALPFEPESYLGKSLPSSKTGLATPNASVYFMPCCGGFFGGDAVSCMLYNQFDKDGDRYMADIGTNGEMALSSGGNIYGCSTAAGPAFEGACIRFGTGSIEGAINAAKEDGNGGFSLKTVGDKAPCGICGSGLIDLIAAGLRTEMIDETGRLDDDLPEFEDDPAIRVTDDIYLTQKDVREIQLAKSAICAGTTVLANKCQKLPEVFIAGGFGSAIHLDSASYIGLLPNEYCKNAKAVGNAALKGAVMCLLSKNARMTAEKLRERTIIIDLSTDPVFQDEYVENMMFEI